MGKCYCDYCDVFLTNDSVAVRKQHNEGNRHKYNVCEYYRQHIANQLQAQIDQIVVEFDRKVAHGLVMPTYGLPPPPKPVAQPTPTGKEGETADQDEDAKEDGKGIDRPADGPAYDPVISVANGADLPPDAKEARGPREETVEPLKQPQATA